jgi:tetratricopeptide (TPR) repeat protein
MDNDSFEFFVSYYEDTGKDFAGRIYDLFKKKGYKVYVNHKSRDIEHGKFRDNIDKIINESKVFILLNTYGTLSRTEVKREVKTAFPEGGINKEFWILLHNGAESSNNKFKEETMIDLKEYTYQSFHNDSELARKIYRLCDERKSRSNTDMSPFLQNLPVIQPQIIIKSPSLIDYKIFTLNIGQLRNDARIFFDKKSYDASLEIYEQILDNMPNDIESLNAIGIIMGIKGNYENSLEKFLSAIYLNRKNSQLYYNTSIAYFYKKEYTNSLIYIRKALELEDKNINFINHEAFINFVLEDFITSKQLYEKAYNIANNSISLIGKAVTIYRLGEKDEALQLLETISKNEPRNYSAFYNIGVIYMDDNKYDVASKYFDQAIELNPSDFNSLTNRAKISRLQSKTDEALQYYSKAIESRPHYFEGYYNKGTALAFKGDYKESLTYFDLALSKKPDAVNAKINKAEALRQLRKFGESRKILQSIPDYENNFKVLYIQGLTFFDEKRYPEAEIMFKRALQISYDYTVKVDLLSSLENQKKYEEALLICNKELDTNPRDIVLIIFKIHLLIRGNQLENALDLCLEFVNLYPDEPTLYYNMAAANSLLGRKEDALFNLRKAIYLNIDFKSQLLSDNDFDSLKNLPEYQEIINS